VTRESRSRALKRAHAEEKKILMAGDALGGTGGDVILVKIQAISQSSLA
jgi:hypothetical protein